MSPPSLVFTAIAPPYRPRKRLRKTRRVNALSFTKGRAHEIANDDHDSHVLRNDRHFVDREPNSRRQYVGAGEARSPDRPGGAPADPRANRFTSGRSPSHYRSSEGRCKSGQWP